MSSSIQIKVKVKGDEELEDVVENMITFAISTKMDVTTKFNGHTLTVVPDDIPSLVVKSFSNKMYLKSNH